MVTVLRPLTTSEVLDRTFHLYRKNLLLFFAITAIPQLFVFALNIFLGGYRDPRHMGPLSAATYGIGISSLVALEIAHAATVIAVSNLHLERPASIGSAYSGAKACFIRVIKVGLTVIFVPLLIAIPVAAVVVVIVGITSMATGNVALIRFGSTFIAIAALLAGLRWWLSWALVIPVTVLEGGGVRTSMRRSRTLTKGSRGRIFLIYLLLGVLGWIVHALIRLPISAMFGRRFWTYPLGLTFGVRTLSAAGDFVGTSLVGALGEIAITVIYYDLRVRKEGFDLQLMMANLEGNPQPAAAAMGA